MLFFTVEGVGEAEERKDKNKNKPRKSTGREIVEWIICFACAFALAIFIRMFIFEFIRVEGPSMESTLIENEYMFVTKPEYMLGDPQRGDVIVCRYPDSKLEYVKRVIGLPGDTVLVMGGGAFINDYRLDEPYLDELMTRDFGPYIVPEGCYFVMGDNRNISMDSRDAHVGALERNMIIGHVRAVVWPLSNARWLPEAPVFTH